MRVHVRARARVLNTCRLLVAAGTRARCCTSPPSTRPQWTADKSCWQAALGIERTASARRSLLAVKGGRTAPTSDFPNSSKAARVLVRARCRCVTRHFCAPCALQCTHLFRSVKWVAEISPESSPWKREAFAQEASEAYLVGIFEDACVLRRHSLSTINLLQQFYTNCNNPTAWRTHPAANPAHKPSAATPAYKSCAATPARKAPAATPHVCRANVPDPARAFVPDTH